MINNILPTILAFSTLALGMQSGTMHNFLKARTALYRLPVLHNAEKTGFCGYSLINARAELLKKINELNEAFPHRVLLRYRQDFNNNNSEHLKRLKEEFIRYALLAKLSGKNIGMFSKDVDNLWHTFLLFNKDYETFCLRLAATQGERFMLYHNPHEEAETCPQKCMWDHKEHFIKEYQKLYQEPPSTQIWSALKPCNTTRCKGTQNADKSKSSPCGACFSGLELASLSANSSCSSNSCSSSCGSSCGGGD